MSDIKAIKIKNFQSIKEATFELGKVTIIKGSSDVGKSAVVRAIKAFLFNRFESGYAHKGEHPFGVAIQTEDGVAIGRRTEKGVEYKLGSTIFSKTQRQVPQEIMDFIGIKEYTIDSDLSIVFNIQSQFDTPFLLSDKPATIAKVIGRISYLNIVMSAIRKIAADKQRFSNELGIVGEQKTVYANKLKQFVRIKEYVKLGEQAKALSKEIEMLEVMKNDLESLLQRVADNLDKRKRVDAFLKLFPSDFDSLLSTLEEETTKLNKVNDIFVRVANSVVKLKTNETLLSAFSLILSTGDEFLGSLSKVDSLNAVSARADKFKHSWKMSEQAVREVTDSLFVLEQDLTKELALVTVCPLSKGELFEPCKKAIYGN